jgi:drug/metabolite transporter (DMT)-like permease
MTGALSPHRKGIVLVVAAAIAWSTAPFFTRLLPFDSWTILFWRGLFGGALIATILVLLQSRSGLQDFTRMERSGWLVASLSTLGMVCFIPALQLTSTSNVAIIIATGPFVTAALAWIALSNILGRVVSIPFAQGIAAVTGFDLFIFAMFGFFQVALGLTLYMLGSRLLPSGQAALIATLETPLMPFWVWLAFQEVPSSRALVGGALVMGAVIADIIGDNGEQKQPA